MHARHGKVDHGGSDRSMQTETSMSRFGTNLVSMNGIAGIEAKAHAARLACHITPQIGVVIIAGIDGHARSTQTEQDGAVLARDRINRMHELLMLALCIV